MTNELIYGKDSLEKVVSVEIEDSGAIVFIENQDGSVKIESRPFKPYILFAKQYSDKMKRLKGDQPYRWFYEAKSIEGFGHSIERSYANHYDFYAIRDLKEAFLVKSGVTYYKNMKPQEVSTLSFDLEHCYGIGSQLDPKGTLFLISNTFRRNGKTIKKLFSLDEFRSEKEMLNEWCDWVREMNPSIMLGHNIFMHDLQILKFAAQKNNAELLLGRDNSPVKFNEKESKKRKDGSQSYNFTNAFIYGRELIDTYFLALTYDVGRKYESYGLKQIIKQEGLEKKDRQHYEAKNIAKDWLKLDKRSLIKRYAVDDADDALSLFDLMIPSYFYYTQSIPRSFQQIINTATGAQLNSLMIRSYLQAGYGVARQSEPVEFEGAISFGKPGIHKNVLRFDVASLYPSIMRQYKIYSPDKDPEAHFSKLVEYFTIERLKNKKLGKETGDRYYKDIEQAQKIVINSAYGLLGSRNNYNYPKGAAKVTRYGRQILKQAIYFLSGEEYE